jgi:hypothetical protein
MSLSNIFVLWAGTAIFGIVSRPRMIWQEKNRNYRFTLLVLTFPAQMIVSLAGIAFGQIVATVDFWKYTMAGEDPGKEPK